MAKEGKMEFCTACRKPTAYHLQQTWEKERICNKEYTFRFTTAFCTECRKKMHIPGLIDRNNQERDEQYRRMERLISVEEIQKLLNLCLMGPDALSAALGFDRQAIGCYLQGQMPSREHSDIMRRALAQKERRQAAF